MCALCDLLLVMCRVLFSLLFFRARCLPIVVRCVSFVGSCLCSMIVRRLCLLVGGCVLCVVCCFGVVSHACYVLCAVFHLLFV